MNMIICITIYHRVGSGSFSYQKKRLNLNLLTLKSKKWHFLNVFAVFRKFFWGEFNLYYAQFESVMEENYRTEIKNGKIIKKQNWEIENVLLKGKMNSDMASYSGLALCKSNSTRGFKILGNLKIYMIC